MGDETRIDVEGLPTLLASLDRLADDLAELAPGDAADVIRSAAARRAPKRSGFLANSFRSATASGVIKLTWGAAYAGALNFGTGPRSGLRGPHNIRATRFATGAITDNESTVIDAYRKAADNAVSRVKGA